MTFLNFIQAYYDITNVITDALSAIFFIFERNGVQACFDDPHHIDKPALRCCSYSDALMSINLNSIPLSSHTKDFKKRHLQISC